jgi:hypothetical protein
VRTFNSRNRHVGLPIRMKVEELTIIHPVDMIAGQDQDKVWFCIFQEAKILKNGICRTVVSPTGHRTHAMNIEEIF